MFEAALLTKKKKKQPIILYIFYYLVSLESFHCKSKNKNMWYFHFCIFAKIPIFCAPLRAHYSLVICNFNRLWRSASADLAHLTPYVYNSKTFSFIISIKFSRKLPYMEDISFLDYGRTDPAVAIKLHTIIEIRNNYTWIWIFFC